MLIEGLTKVQPLVSISAVAARLLPAMGAEEEVESSTTPSSARIAVDISSGIWIQKVCTLPIPCCNGWWRCGDINALVRRRK